MRLYKGFSGERSGGFPDWNVSTFREVCGRGKRPAFGATEALRGAFLPPTGLKFVAAAAQTEGVCLPSVFCAFCIIFTRKKWFQSALITVKNLGQWVFGVKKSSFKALGWIYSTLECVALEFRLKGQSRRRFSPRPSQLSSAQSSLAPAQRASECPRHEALEAHGSRRLRA